MTSKFSIDNRELLQRISSGEAVVGIDFGNLIVRELAAFRLAAMDSEPVIVVGDDGGDALSYRRLIQSFEPGTKLYRHAQPVPVVPEEAYSDDCPELYPSQPDAWAAGWNACRAAMLAAAPQPQNEPQNIPEIIPQWIPVSEGMPKRGDYLVTDGRDFNVQTFDGDQFIPGFVWDDGITHWMPLPAAPQEAK